MSEKKDASVWNVGSIRLTAFPTNPIKEPSSQSWWSELIGSSPAKRIESPAEGTLCEEGPFSSEKLQLIIRPHRIDWNCLSSQETSTQTAAVPDIGNWPEPLDEFSKLAKDWMKVASFPELQRLALGAILFQPAISREEGYKRLSRYLPCIQIDPAGSSDFFYQINRPRDKSRVFSDIKVNRLTRWHVIHSQTGVFSMERSVAIPGQEHFNCALEIDINSQADFRGALQNVEALYDEFVALAVEISKKGDVK